MRTNPQVLAALRATYRFVFLDEFQDTTGVQYRLMHTAFEGSPAILTAVGDNKQRIMLWAGAQVGVFDAFKNNFGATCRGLMMNYRSAPRLVAIQRLLIAALDPESPAPQAADDGTTGEGECRVILFPNETSEARHIASLISTWIRQDGPTSTRNMASRHLYGPVCNTQQCYSPSGRGKSVQRLVSFHVRGQASRSNHPRSEGPLTRSLPFGLTERPSSSPRGRACDRWPRRIPALGFIVKRGYSG